MMQHLANFTPPNHRPVLTLVIPMYNESEGMGLLFSRLRPILGTLTEDYEILCVNDGSGDDTLAKLKSESVRDPRIKYISLSRNFGKEAALTAGLHHAYGQAVIPFDADLQDPPEVIPELFAKWREGYKVVLATRRTRATDSFAKRVTARLFYRMIGKMTAIPIPADTGDFRLMDAAVVDIIRMLPERTRFMKGLFAWVGFSSTTVYFDRAPRAAGVAKLKFFSLWTLAKDGIFSFTTLPLRISTYAGVFVSFIAICYGLYLVIKTLVLGVEVPGYASIMTTVLFIGGLQMLSIGILGEYIGRIYREAKQRPLYVVEDRNI